VTVDELFTAIDSTLLLKPVKLRIRSSTGEVTTYYITRDNRPGEFPLPEKAQ
jgi:hypothetical protein